MVGLAVEPASSPRPEPVSSPRPERRVARWGEQERVGASLHTGWGSSRVDGLDAGGRCAGLVHVPPSRPVRLCMRRGVWGGR